jgi:hypothetical protein
MATFEFDDAGTTVTMVTVTPSLELFSAVPRARFSVATASRGRLDA